jgi:hypothetical protein
MREPAVLGVIGRAGRFYSVIGLRRLLALSGMALSGMALSGSDESGPDAMAAHLLLLRGAAPHLALAVDRVLGRYDLAGNGPTFDLDGRLVALFDPETLHRRFGHPANEAPI